MAPESISSSKRQKPQEFVELETSLSYTELQYLAIEFGEAAHNFKNSHYNYLPHY